MKPPEHLTESTRTWFADVCSRYELESHHLRLLTLAGEAWDRCNQARMTIDREGLVFMDNNDCPRTRPEIAIERDSRLAFVRIIRELDLDTEAPVESSRAPALRSIRR